MRILIVTGIFPPDAGGPATYVPRIAGALARRDHVVSVVTLSDVDRHPDDDGAAFRLLRIRRAIPRPLRLPLTVLALVRAGWRADVLLVNGLYMEAGVANAFLRKPLVQKIVGDWVWERARNAGWTRHGFDEFQSASHGPRIATLKLVRNLTLRAATLTLTPSRYLARWAQRWGAAPANVRVIPNAVDPAPAPSHLDIPLDTPRRVVTVGRLVGWKGVDLLLETLPALDKDVGLVVVGDGPEESRLRELAARLGVLDRVCFLGRLDRGGVFAALRGADVFVLNSNYEGLPHVVLEAMLAGVPVVATDAGGTSEVVEHGHTGLLVPAGNRAALASALDRVLGDAEMRRRLGETGRAAAQSRFAPARMVEDTERALLEAVVAGRPAAARAFARSAATRLTRGLGRHATGLTLANVVSAVTGLIQGLVVARALGVEQYGVATLVMGYPTLLFGFMDARSADATTRYLGEFHARGERTRALAVCKLGYAVDLVMALVTFAAVLGTARWAASHVVHVEGMAPLIVLYGAAFLVRGLIGTPASVLASLERFDRVAWIEAATAVGRSTLVAGVALAGYGVAGVVWASTLGLAGYGIAYLVAGAPVARRVWGSWRSASLADLGGVRWTIARLYVQSSLHGWFLIVPRQFDVMALGHLRGPVEVGHYRVAKGLQTLVNLGAAPAVTAVYPRLTRLISLGQWAQAVQLRRRLLVIVGLPFAAVALAMALVAPDLIGLLVGDEFRPAGGSARVLLSAGALWAVFFWLRPWYLAVGRFDEYVRWHALSLLPFVLGYVTVVPAWGALGMAACYAAHVLLFVAPLGARALRRRPAGAD